MLAVLTFSVKLLICEDVLSTLSRIIEIIFAPHPSNAFVPRMKNRKLLETLEEKEKYLDIYLRKLKIINIGKFQKIS